MQLYEISALIREVLAGIEDNAGELTADAEAKLATLAEQWEVKAEAVALWHHERRAEADVIEDEIIRLKARQLAAERSAAWAKTYLERELKAAGRKSLRTPRVSATVCANGSPAVRILTDAERLPAEFQVQTTTVAPDRQALLDAHRAGRPLPDGVFVSYGTHVRVK